MEARTQAQTQTSSPAFQPPPRSFDRQRIRDAMTEDEKEESHRLIENSEPHYRRLDMLAFVSSVIGRLEKESPEQLYAADSRQPQPPHIPGQKQVGHRPTSGSDTEVDIYDVSDEEERANRKKKSRSGQTPQRRQSSERTLSKSSATSSRGSSRTSLPGHSSFKLGAPPPPPDFKDVTRPPQSKEARVAKAAHQKKKRISAEKGKETKPRNTTKNETERAQKILAEGIENPYGPCGPCNKSGTTCIILLDEGTRCAKCTKSKGSGDKCLAGQEKKDPSILKAARKAATAAATAAAGSQVGPPLPPAFHHQQSLGGSDDPQPPDQIDSNETDKLP
ncbi:hypothetical protein PG984_009263 [Apiospora sp. TS-2023a]